MNGRGSCSHAAGDKIIDTLCGSPMPPRAPRDIGNCQRSDSAAAAEPAGGRNDARSRSIPLKGGQAHEIEMNAAVDILSV